MLLLLSTALASDMFPGWSNPSVAPTDDVVQVEVKVGGDRINQRPHSFEFCCHVICLLSTNKA